MSLEMLGIEVIQVYIEEVETLNCTVEPTDSGVGNGGKPTAAPGAPEASPTPDE